jgi:hypothetical protein
MRTQLAADLATSSERWKTSLNGCTCREPTAATKCATAVLAKVATNTFSSTRHTRIRSAGAQRKKFTKFETQNSEKLGERNGGVIQRGQGEVEGGRKDGDGDREE